LLVLRLSLGSAGKGGCRTGRFYETTFKNRSSKMPICITFDTERDFYSSQANKKLGYRDKEFSMLERAIPKLIEIGDEYDIPYTFFLCGEVAENCKDLFSNLGRHTIGVHTHPFTHSDIFKGLGPNDYEADLLGKYSFDEQYQMISRDLQLVADNIGVEPKVFRAGKFSANQDTFTVLDKLGFVVDCSTSPAFQIIGWRPFKIAGTSVWEMPTYCDFSPELAYYLGKLLRVSSIAHSLTHAVYVGIIHPMIFGNPTINTGALFSRYKELIESMLEWGFNFMTVQQALEQARNRGGLLNTVGRMASVAMLPIHYLIMKVIQ
jgi:peptidoglycan/xylan/chitin deacetylase (PgdA/CDA1 family)